MSAGRASPATHFAGWLIADVMVLLFVVGMSAFSQDATAEPPEEGDAAAEPTTTLPPTTTLAPTTTAAPRPAGVEQRPFCVSISPGGDAAGELSAVLDRHGLGDRPAGLVMSFGIAGDPGPGRALAEGANARLRRLPNFAAVPMRHFWDTSGPSGGVNVEVYFLTQPGRDLPASSCPWIGS